MNRISFALLLSLFAPVQALMVVPSARMAPRTQMNLMTPGETNKVMTQANDCYEGECSLDEVEDLIQLLKGQQKELYDRVEQVRGMVKTLEASNAQSDRKTDEIRDTVRALFRVFQLGDSASGNDYPSLSKPTGWSGEVGDGPTTAYDSLPPKKWTNPDKK